MKWTWSLTSEGLFYWPNKIVKITLNRAKIIFKSFKAFFVWWVSVIYENVFTLKSFNESLYDKMQADINVALRSHW